MVFKTLYVKVIVVVLVLVFGIPLYGTNEMRPVNKNQLKGTWKTEQTVFPPLNQIMRFDDGGGGRAGERSIKWELISANRLEIKSSVLSRETINVYTVELNIPNWRARWFSGEKPTLSFIQGGRTIIFTKQ